MYESDEEPLGEEKELDLQTHIRRRSCYCTSCGGENLQKKAGYKIVLDHERDAITRMRYNLDDLVSEFHNSKFMERKSAFNLLEFEDQEFDNSKATSHTLFGFKKMVSKKGMSI